MDEDRDRDGKGDGDRDGDEDINRNGDGVSNPLLRPVRGDLFEVQTLLMKSCKIHEKLKTTARWDLFVTELC